VTAQEFYNTFLQFPQICTDSRKVIPGCLYFALKGDHFDGNLFAADALSKGCAFAVVDDHSVVASDRYVLVPDVLKFLQDLAAFHRRKLSIPVIGLTGTNGKTTTKELIHSVLKQKYATVATTGNYNNHIGVPITLLAADQHTEVLIVEMGANHPGEIAALCAIAQPDFGLITNIGRAHLEGFGSFEGVIQTKNELYRWIIDHQGTLFVNDDDLLLKSLVNDYPCYTYGTSKHAAISGQADHPDRYLSVTWQKQSDNQAQNLQSHLTGGYNLQNILAAVSVGTRFGLNPSQIREGIESYVPDNMRSQWIQTDKNVLFLDAYNANPSSMELALNNFASLQLPHAVVILGDMFELGSYSSEEHLKIIQLADRLGFEKVLLIGEHFSQFSSDFSFLFFKRLDQLKVYLTQNLIQESNILIKGSRGMKLEQVVCYL